MGVIETLDKLANSLKTPSKLGTIGGMAAEMIKGHIHSGQGFAPLSRRPWITADRDDRYRIQKRYAVRSRLKQ